MPPAIVLPVKVSALGSEIVGLPETPSPFDSATSLAVPVIVRTAHVPDPVRAMTPVDESAARQSRSASHAWTADPIVRPNAVRAADAVAALVPPFEMERGDVPGPV